MNSTSRTTWRNASKPKGLTPAPARRKKRAGAGARRDGRAALLFLAPSLVGLAVFFLLPLANTVRRSFYDARGKNFAGLSSYQSVFENSAFRLATANTARFVAVCIPLLLAASLILALLVRAVRPGGRSFKTSYLLPMAVPVASIVLLWQVLFHQNGLLNTVLTAFGAQPADFLNTSVAFWVLVGTYLWKNSGYNMILWLAGLDGISQSLYEAAKVDGAGTWQCFTRVTLPSLAPTMGLVSILSLLNSFKVFREAYLVRGAYPHDSMYLLQHLFNNWFVNLDISRLCAAAVLLTLVLLGLILPVQRLMQSPD